ncbi:TPA: hypothetical protein ACHJPE_002892 [Escherichia coli]|uniref:hypothetical protein n=2 Tax=Escherichia coli TaxID=562 RepID=UPI0003911F6E|nr:hypothetical protein [Escherichia coli]EFZ2274204.1 hypothetical protein [Shigella sonnei]EEQ2458689.1 hypothetical protein [Escherichia coli]EEQ6524467.1 hypothetical protein [Escherichia coli]EEQ9687114.1 hypothetical protein [Escherichia coli]EEQ9773712.1 hypothetical protein [Escherichia coli]
MWTLLSALISAIAAFFGARKADTAQSEKQLINRTSRTGADITRKTQRKTEREIREATDISAADSGRVRASGSVSERTGIINDAIRRVNGEGHR